ncbi:hypothetical protein CJ179_46435 [Rhodococcus sp. ACS1]|nr:hypothetical protein CJ179_46435 [Rhodococcus sp. ACS1]
MGIRLDSLARIVVGVFPILATAGLVVWDLWLWKAPLLKLLTHRPRIDGLWKVTLTPAAGSHIPVGGNWGPIPAYVVISQSYWSLHVRQMTAESASSSKAFFWDHTAGADAETLSFLYQNGARPEHAKRSPRHLGTCSFDIARREPTEIEGRYFTDRYTQGGMELRLVDRSKGHASYQDADTYVGNMQSDQLTS